MGHCGLKPWQQGSQWKHSQIVWMISNVGCVIFLCCFFGVGVGFVLYGVVRVEALGSVIAAAVTGGVDQAAAD